MNGKLYVVGGFVEGWTPTDDVHEYDPPSDRWQRLAALPTPRAGGCCARWQDLRGRRCRLERLDDRRFRKVFPRFDFTEFGAGLSATVAVTSRSCLIDALISRWEYRPHPLRTYAPTFEKQFNECKFLGRSLADGQ